MFTFDPRDKKHSKDAIDGIMWGATLASHYICKELFCRIWQDKLVFQKRNYKEILNLLYLSESVFCISVITMR